MIRWILAPLLLLWTFTLALFHSGVVRPPLVSADAPAQAKWIDAQKAGIHQLVLSGSAYGRGLKAGQLTKHLLLEQEDVLNGQMENWLPSRWMRQAGVLALIAWYQGLDDYLEPEHLQEMYGVSKSAPKKYEYLADNYTRQIAYHGLHEVGQMMVDQGFEGMGCTVAAIRRGKNWILGRNFDFEGGRIFDSQKIMKWVFPDSGHAFVSVIWAGMVGAVTGVNEKGVYISINAAGSSDFRRVGTPSTLVILNVLQRADSTAQAIQILEKAKMFITDIFVVSDAAGHLVVVEKSPLKTAVRKIQGNAVVTNHLLSPEFSNDPTNKKREADLTTLHRFERGQQLTAAVQPGLDYDGTVLKVLEILRDKGVSDKSQPLTLGNRRAIDALIATHAVILDGERDLLYVSQGPALAGKFIGFDLRESFRQRQPVFKGELPRDPLVSDETFQQIKDNTRSISEARGLIRRKQCVHALSLLKKLEGAGLDQSGYHHALGDAHACLNSKIEARAEWAKALQLTPAYAKEERAIRRSLEQ